ncbi:MAG: hypothetical protein IH621_12440, partial [Krumholzibacteria bacterium]|nr:hypothetical protein [Candidatus Krumholzibacteria bacterium]
MPSEARQGNVRAVRRFLVRGAAVVAFLAPGGAPAPAAAGSPTPAPVAERPLDAAAWDDHR